MSSKSKETKEAISNFVVNDLTSLEATIFNCITNELQDTLCEMKYEYNSLFEKYLNFFFENLE